MNENGFLYEGDYHGRERKPGGRRFFMHARKRDDDPDAYGTLVYSTLYSA